MSNPFKDRLQELATTLHSVFEGPAGEQLALESPWGWGEWLLGIAGVVRRGHGALHVCVHHPLGLPAGALRSEAKERLIAVRRGLPDQSVFVFPWCEGWGAAAGGGVLRSSPWPLMPVTHPCLSTLFGSAGLLPPRCVSLVVWARCLQGCQTKSPPLVTANLDLVAAPAAVLNVKGLHLADGQLHWGLHAAHGPEWQQGCCLPGPA